MARVALEIPKVGLVMENARLVRWLKNVGELVKQGEPLLELETEKSVVEIESTESGRLVEILMQVDQEARVGDRIAWLESDVAAPVAAHPISPAGAPSPASAPSQSKQGAASPPTAAVASPTPAPAERHRQTMLTPDQERRSGRVKSSPVARRLAAQHALDLGLVTPTGPRGRVQLIDVRQAIETRTARGAASAPAGLRPLSSMRRALARSVTLSNATVPQFIVERAVDWSRLQRLREQLNGELPPGRARLSVNDFLIQGIARTLIAFPWLNATFCGDPSSPDAGLLPASGAHIGLVVAVDNGLLVPVFHGVERLGLAELARRRSDTVERALKGKLRREELEGATFSLSNLGARGPDRFTAIISPPQSAILAVGRQRDCVVAAGGGIQVKPMSQLTLTVDHRVADGRLASEFLASLAELIEGASWRLY